MLKINMGVIFAFVPLMLMIQTEARYIDVSKNIHLRVKYFRRVLYLSADWMNIPAGKLKSTVNDKVNSSLTSYMKDFPILGHFKILYNWDIISTTQLNHHIKPHQLENGESQFLNI